MMSQEKMQEEDEVKDESMIKAVLQKIIDEMNGMEADRINPKKEPIMLSAGSDGIPNPADNSAETPEEAEPENQDNQHEELDPSVLKTLLETAGNDSESQSDSDFLDLPPAIADVVRKKKGLK
jgi:hypothetical protein